MEAVPALEAHGETQPLVAARLRRQLTVESAAARRLVVVVVDPARL